MFSSSVLSLFRARGWALNPLASRARDNADPGQMIDAEFDGLFAARIDLKNRAVALVDAGGTPIETLEHFVCDLLLPRLLAHDGKLVLHAGVVGSRAGGLGFLGPSGAGKSTLSAALYRRGYPLLSDDVVVLEAAGRQVLAERLYPSLRLFQDTIHRVLPETPPQGKVAHYSEKQRLAVSDGPDSVMMAALFVLGPPPTSGAVLVRRLNPAKACVALLSNAFQLRPEDREEAQRKFHLAAGVAHDLPVYGLDFPRDYALLDEVIVRVLEAVGAGSEAVQGSMH